MKESEQHMEIRKALPADLPELMSLYSRMCEVLGKADFLHDGNKGGFPSEDMVASAIERAEQFVGIEDGRIAAAYIMDHECDDAYDEIPWATEGETHEISILHALRVLPEYGGRGFSKQLVEHAIETARERRQKALRLDCIEGNDVPQRMYRSYGFEPAGVADITYPDIGVPRKFILYELQLDR